MPRKDRKPAEYLYQQPDKLGEKMPPALDAVLGNLSFGEDIARETLTRHDLWDEPKCTFKPSAICLDLNHPAYHAARLLQESAQLRAYLKSMAPEGIKAVLTTMSFEHIFNSIVNGPHIAAARRRNEGKRKQSKSGRERMTQKAAIYNEAKKIRGKHMVWEEFNRLCEEQGKKGWRCASDGALEVQKSAWRKAGVLK